MLLKRAPKQDGFLVVGSQGLDALDRFMLGSVSTKLFHHATCPVLVVKDEEALLWRITLATDGSSASAQALRRRLAYRSSSKDQTPIAAYKATRRAEGAAAKTINHDLALLGHAFQLAVKEWEWVAENPVHKVSKENVRNLIERWLSAEEERRLLVASPVWLQEIILFAIHTGFRQSEILNLQWVQVDLFRRTITLLEQKNGGRDTLPVECVKTLEALKARANVRSRTTEYVFSNGAGNRRDARDLLRVFNPVMKKADVRRFRFHDLRHTFATRLVQAGADIYTVQKLGRWKTISMVLRYAHHHSESLRAGIEMLDWVPAGMSTI